MSRVCEVIHCVQSVCVLPFLLNVLAVCAGGATGQQSAAL